MNVTSHYLFPLQLLELIQKILLASNENLLILFYDSKSSEVAAEILRQNITQPKIVYKYEVERINKNQNIFYDNAIVISILSHSHSSFFITNAYMNDRLNVMSKHLCVINERPDQESDEMINYFRSNFIHFVVVQWTSNEFIIHTFALPYIQSNREIIRIPAAKAFCSANPHEMIFPFNMNNINVTYFATNFNPPLLYRVQDFSISNRSAETFIDGIEVKMTELLMYQFNWNINFMVMNYSSINSNDCKECEVYRKFSGKIFRTTVPLNRHHNIDLPNMGSGYIRSLDDYFELTNIFD